MPLYSSGTISYAEYPLLNNGFMGICTLNLSILCISNPMTSTIIISGVLKTGLNMVVREIKEA